jgi:aryl carrier protein AsbD
MNRIEIIEKLKVIIEENLEHELPENLKEEDGIYDDLGIDSIMVLQLIIYIEEEFGIEVPEDSIDPEVFETVGSLVTFIQALKPVEEHAR